MHFRIISIMFTILFFPILSFSHNLIEKGKIEKLHYYIYLKDKIYYEKSVGYIKNNGDYFYISEGNHTSKKVYKKGGYHKWEVLADKYSKPIKINYQVGENNLNYLFKGHGLVHVQGTWNKKIIDIEKIFKPNVTIETAFLARSLNFQRKERYIFDLIQLSELPYLEAYEMFFKVIEDQKIEVPAGIFMCKKVIFSLTGFKGYFFKAYFYISIEKPNYIVKIENLPINGRTELIEYSSENK